MKLTCSLIPLVLIEKNDQKAQFGRMFSLFNEEIDKGKKDMTLKLGECTTFSVLVGCVRKTFSHFTINYIYKNLSKTLMCWVLVNALNMGTIVLHPFS